MKGLTTLALTSLLLLTTTASAQRAPGMDPVIDGDFHDDGEPSVAKVELGRQLFFDKVLSGNGNISCATCHHTLTMTGDGLSLPVGEGGLGLGVTRALNGVSERVPRNAPPLYNLGAREFHVLFHDGRLSVDPDHPAGFQSPAGANLPVGLDSILAAQALFPVTSPTEMAGQPGENPQADAAAVGDFVGVWDAIVGRLQSLPDYLPLFQAAYPGIVETSEDIDIVQVGNVIAAFEGAAFRFTDSPFDRWLGGEGAALTMLERWGMRLFYGRAGCSDCHAGVFQTDHAFHAIAMPQIGPGKGDNSPGYTDGHEDFGRERVTGDPADRFRFRTPSLRNVALTAPYGHTGAYDTLEGVIRHHLDPVDALESYRRGEATLPPDVDGIGSDLDDYDFIVMEDAVRRMEIAARNELAPIELDEREMAALMAFLNALTDPAALDVRVLTPMTVPSELPVYD